MAKSQEVRDRFLELRARGHSLSKIADQVGISKQTAVSWNKRYSEQVEVLKQEGLAQLCERFRISRGHRVERVVGQIDKLEKEIDGRELNTVETDRLLRIYVRLMEAARKEIEPSRVEMSGSLGIADPLARWSEIIREVIELVPEPPEIIPGS